MPCTSFCIILLDVSDAGCGDNGRRRSNALDDTSLNARFGRATWGAYPAVVKFHAPSLGNLTGRREDECRGRQQKHISTFQSPGHYDADRVRRHLERIDRLNNCDSERMPKPPAAGPT